jgi:hypothetical protein
MKNQKLSTLETLDVDHRLTSAVEVLFYTCPETYLVYACLAPTNYHRYAWVFVHLQDRPLISKVEIRRDTLFLSESIAVQIRHLFRGYVSAVRHSGRVARENWKKAEARMVAAEIEMHKAEEAGKALKQQLAAATKGKK